MRSPHKVNFTYGYMYSNTFPPVPNPTIDVILYKKARERPNTKLASMRRLQGYTGCFRDDGPNVILTTFCFDDFLFGEPLLVTGSLTAEAQG